MKKRFTAIVFVEIGEESRGEERFFSFWQAEKLRVATFAGGGGDAGGDDDLIWRKENGPPENVKMIWE
ncbi:hypothetical protein SLE2022_119690 [Rubroshorea leprosula]